jgi:hypothetical protein
LPIDWHEPYLLFLAMTILLLSVADAFLTITLIMGGAQEANPLLAFILDEHPEWFAAWLRRGRDSFESCASAPFCKAFLWSMSH